MKKLNVFIVEDNPGDALLIREMIAQQDPDAFEINQVSRLSDAIARIQKGGMDVVLLDLGLPDADGLDTLTRLRDRAQQIPVIILTGHSDQETAVTALREGAEDYLVKGQFSGELLTQAIRYALERKKIKVQFEEQANFLRQLMDAIPMPIFFKDTNHVYQGCNKAFLESIGGTREGIVGKTSYQVAPKELADIYYNKDAELFSRPGIQVYESCVRYADGTPHDVLFTKATYTDKGGNVAGLVGIMLDISDRKRAEEERAKLQNQLLQAQKMESVGRLAGGVAHDFNNVLSVILGYAELVLERIPEEDPLHEDIHEILSAGRRAADITRQLLAFARRQTIAPKVLDLNETVDGMLKMLRRLIGEDIDLTWHPRQDLWPVKLDPVQFDQILANLCVNARDAISDVGKITMETDRVSFDQDYCDDHPGFAPGDFVVLSVTDNGRGMDAETLEKIYEPFFTTKAVGEGTGLGLPTVYGIMKQNNGFINVYSEPRSGTMFKLYFPRHMAAPEPVRPRETEKIFEGHGEIVLVVEDDIMILAMAKKMLTGLGYRVLTASDPFKAGEIAAAHKGDIDLVMTDVIMPVMNGRELSEKLRELYPDLRVLFMSGYTANVIAHHGVLEDGVHFIQKPFSRKELAKKVREALE